MRGRPWSTVERSFVLDALAEGKSDGDALRLDGRRSQEMRSCKITLGPDLGHATVAFGKTKVKAQISCEQAAPFPDRPTEGLVRYAVDLSPMASPGFDSTRATAPLAVELTRLLEHTFKEGRVLDTESLCIVAGEKVWQLRVQATVIDDDGNMGDVCVLATLAALIHFRRPFVEIAGGHVTVHTLESHEPVPLSIHHRPFCITLAIFPSLDTYVVDPSRLEEAVCGGCISVAMNTHNEVCTILSAGGVPIQPDDMLEMMELVKQKTQRLSSALEKALDKGHVSQADLELEEPSPDTTARKITEAVAEPMLVDDDSASDDEDEGARAASVLTPKKAKIVQEDGGAATLFQGQDSWAV